MDIRQIILLAYKWWQWRHIEKHWPFSKEHLRLFYSTAHPGVLFGKRLTVCCPIGSHSANASCLREAVKCDDLWRTPNHSLYGMTQNDIICFHEQGASPISKPDHSWLWRKGKKKSIPHTPPPLNLKWTVHTVWTPFINPLVHKWRLCSHFQIGPQAHEWQLMKRAYSINPVYDDC